MTTERTQEGAAPATEADPFGETVSDEPLVPREPAGDAEAAPEQSPGGGEASREGETREAAQTEQQRTEEPGPPPGYVPQQDLDRLRSSLDRRNNELQREIEQLRQQTSQSQFESQVEAHRRNLQAWYEQQGIDPQQAASRIEEETQRVRDAHTSQSQAQQLQQENASLREQQVSTVMSSWVNELTRQHGLDQEAQQVLRSYYDPRAVAQDRDTFLRTGSTLATLAEQLGSAAKARQEAQSARQERVPAGQRMERGGGSGAMSDADVIRAHAEGRPGVTNQMALEAHMRQGTSPI